MEEQTTSDKPGTLHALPRELLKIRSFFHSRSAIIAFLIVRLVCKLRNLLTSLRIGRDLLLLALKRPGFFSTPQGLRTVSLAGVFLFLAVLASVGLDVPRMLKKNFGIGGPPILRVDSYRIKPQESLWAIAKRNKLSFDTLITINKLNNIHSLRVGQEIIIPNQDGILYKVRNGEDIRSIADKFKVKLEDLLDVNDLTISQYNSLHTNIELFLPGVKLSAEDRLNLLGMSFIRPSAGRIRSAFGWRNDPVSRTHRQFHTGMDFGCGPGTPIRAAADGQVVFAGNKGGYGITVILRHSAGYTTLYAHCSRTAVQQGQFVKAGQVISYSGNTGRTTGPHLHFEVRKYGVPKDPTGALHLTGQRR